jgi:hypothetical protein
MHELCKGCVELVGDSKKVLELFPGRRYDGTEQGYDDDLDEAISLNREPIVLCCFNAALAHVKQSEDQEATRAGATDGPMDVDMSTGLMIEVQSLDCAMNITNAACKLLDSALGTNPQNVAPLTTSELLFAVGSFADDWRSRCAVLCRGATEEDYSRHPYRPGSVR